jgi:peroxiredoxin
VQRLALAVAAALVSLACVACARPRLELQPHDRMPAPGPHTDETPLVTAENAPASVVQGRDGQSFDLASVWADKRVLLVFYMGHWCPHCQKQLGELNEHAGEFAARGATIVAVSTDAPADALALHDHLHLGFELYSDPDLAVITRWGAQDTATNVAKPAVFVVEPGGAISYRHIGESQTDRPSVDQLLAALAPAAAAPAPED